MYPQLRTGIETVRPRCLCQHQDGAGARMSGMANTGERAINIVNDNKPKVREGLSQHGHVEGTRTCVFLVMGHQSSRWKARALPTRLLRQRNMATPYVSPKGKQAARRAQGCAGMRGWKKQIPADLVVKCQAIDILTV